MDKITLNLTVQEVNLIISALAKQPYEAVADILAKIRADSLKQLNPVQPEVSEEE
jgi:hypothetical protein